MSSNGSNNFSPFYEDGVIILNTEVISGSRSFEQLITERGDLYGCAYTGVFLNLKLKAKALIEEPILISDKFIETQHIIKKFKQDATSVYSNKLKNELLLEENKRRFSNFTNLIEDSIKIISDITTVFRPEDTTLTTLLNERINWYYKELDIDNLIKKQSELNSEFESFKKIISEISEIVPTICSVCLDNEIGWFINPCGHTFCEKCKPDLDKNKKCHICSVKKTKCHKLFL